MIIHLEINQRIIGKQRPRYSRGVFYTPKETKKDQEIVKKCFLEKYPHHNIIQYEDEVSVEIECFFAKPKKSKFSYPIKTCDLDNISKTVLDALNGVAYMDDKQISSLRISKKYGDQDKVVLKIYT